MSAFLQDVTGDLDLSTRQLVIEKDVAATIAAKIQARFKRVLGEWFLNTQEGIPYFQVVFVKNPNVQIISQLYRSVITSTPGIKQIETFDLTYDPKARTCVFNFTARTDADAIIAGGSGQPFIVAQGA